MVMLKTDTIIIDGKKISQQIIKELEVKIADYALSQSRVPGLAVVLVGNNPASRAYVTSKKKTCSQIGIQSFEYCLPEDVSESELLGLIDQLNQDGLIDGILVQLPLPSHINENLVIESISPSKDVDGFHPISVGKLLIGLDTFKSCTPYGVLRLLAAYNIDPAGKHVVIVGRSNIVGKPVAAMLVQREAGANATVTIAHSQTDDLTSITRQADILIAAIGKASFITADMVKQGAVVIDVGINKVDDSSTDKGYRLVGDVDYDAVLNKAKAITPVPGGVGPMTIAMLMDNTLMAYEKKMT